MPTPRQLVLALDRVVNDPCQGGHAAGKSPKCRRAWQAGRLNRVDLGVHCEHSVLLDGATFVLLTALPLTPIRHELEMSGEEVKLRSLLASNRQGVGIHDARPTPTCRGDEQLFRETGKNKIASI